MWFDDLMLYLLKIYEGLIPGTGMRWNPPKKTDTLQWIEDFSKLKLFFSSIISFPLRLGSLPKSTLKLQFPGKGL